MTFLDGLVLSRARSAHEEFMAGYWPLDNDFLDPCIKCLLFGYYITVRRPVIGVISCIGPVVIGIINEYRLQQGSTVFCATAGMYCHPFAHLSCICNVDVMDPLPFWVYFKDPSLEASKISDGTSQKEN